MSQVRYSKLSRYAHYQLCKGSLSCRTDVVNSCYSELNNCSDKNEWVSTSTKRPPCQKNSRIMCSSVRRHLH